MTEVLTWVEGARPRTLPAAVVPVLVGTASVGGHAVAWRSFAALIVALGLQVGANYANDYHDGQRGVDAVRTGPRRLVASGLAPPNAVRRGALGAFGVAALAGLALAAVTSYWLVVVGAGCLGAAWCYAGGPRPYGAAGMGEVGVFVFFGVVAVLGSAYVNAGDIPLAATIAAVPVGGLAAALLVVNNVRDRPGDEAAGKATLAVRIGDVGARKLFLGLLIAAAAGDVALAVGSNSPWCLLALAAAPLAAPPVRAVLGGESGAALIPALGATARLHLVHGVLLAAGLTLGR